MDALVQARYLILRPASLGTSTNSSGSYEQWIGATLWRKCIDITQIKWLMVYANK